MNYIARTTPAADCFAAAEKFDEAVAESLEAALSQKWTPSQRQQVSFSSKQAGLGLSAITPQLDAAYVASRAATQDICSAVRQQQIVWDTQASGSPLAEAVQRIDTYLGSQEILRGDHNKVTQTRLNKLMTAKRMERWGESVTPADKVRKNAYSAKGAGKLFRIIPSKALDTKLTSGEFVTNVACLLGVDVMEGGEPCPKCGVMLDCKGTHPKSCMAGGDKNILHNAVRDVYEDYSRRGGLRPEREAPGLMADTNAEQPSQERPADILIIPSLALARELPDGSRAVRTERVCLDFAVVNALGSNHWSQTAVKGGMAAEDEDQRKRRHNNTEARCAERGLTFWPVIFEQQGGQSKAAYAATRAIAEAVADREGGRASDIRQEMNQRVAILLARATASMIARRQPRFQARQRAFTARSWQAINGLRDDDSDEDVNV